jgi:glycerophosphoryl diester phosphodiesterase
MSRYTLLSTFLAVTVLATLVSADSRAGDPHREGKARRLPLVLGHRGAAGYLPEHTLASYELAISQGADYIEPDLVSTKDGVLIARHEINITDTTDVATRPQFAGRRTTKMIDGFADTGWFADDFTLAEIKTLRAKQRVAFRPPQFDGLFEIPTFDEVLRLAQRAHKNTGRVIGVYPETKHPTYHQQHHLALEGPLVRLLDRYGWNKASAPVFIQSFEVANLRKLNRMTNVRLVQLIDAWDINADGSINSDPALQFNRPYDFVVSGDPRGYVDLLTPGGLAEVATYADGIGPWKRYIISGAMADLNGNGEADDDVNGDGQVNDADRARTAPTPLIANAHQAGLFVHTWTFRNEARYLLGDYGDDPVQEYFDFYCAGVDGLFADFPDTAVTARTMFANAPQQVCRPWH